ncbi:MAG: UvrD-helicase domain-containing protein [Chloroflexota bacterium]|nr:UvrD-helicase domain-containing protein [Chloroflexota bacterium]
MEPTAAQKTAIETLDRNLIVVAGAGSGKTRVLVERYLTLLDQNPTWELNQIVAITFTQKAAQEMRERVRKTIFSRLSQAQTEGNDDAAAVWSRHASALDSARIDTIHALCATLLRQNAAAAAIDPAFEVLDETGASILRTTAIDDLLTALALTDDPCSALFREYPASDIRKLLNAMLAAELPPLPDDLYAHWEARWQEEAAAAMQRLLANEPFVNSAGWFRAHGAMTGDDKLLDIWLMCQRHLDTLFASDDLPVQLAELRRMCDGIKLTGGSAKFWGGQERLDEAKSALKTLRELGNSALDYIGEPLNDRDRDAARLLPLWMRLLALARAAYTDAKRERGALDFDDLEALTRRLLRTQPQVSQRYRRREFQHVLVDEFQDTNSAQWDIVQAIAAPEDQGCLFLVGDPKQSIYSFRGADVSVFDRVRDSLIARGGADVPLVRSFRTHSTLVNGFNALFSSILVRDPDSAGYAWQVALGVPMDAQRADAPNTHPCVELLLIDTTDLKGEDDISGQARRAEAAAIAQRIEQMVTERVLIYDREHNTTRPVMYGDFALLFRAMTHVPLYEDVLKAAGLPFVTIAGRGYYERQEVWDILNLLRALYHPGDNLALAAVLRSPLFALSDDALFALRARRLDDGTLPPLWDALADATGVPADETERLAFAHATLTRLRQSAGRVLIAELIEDALDATGYLAVLTGLPDGARRRGNIEKLLEKARISGKLTLGEFTHYLNDLNLLEAREGEAPLDTQGAIQIMSVHKSKGLEFPVVFLVDTSRKDNARTDLLLHDAQHGLACKVYDGAREQMEQPYCYRRADQAHAAREDAESRRVLYVAATRAQDHLFISGQVSWSKSNKGWSTQGWLKQIMTCYGLDEVQGECDVPFDWGSVRVHVMAANTLTPTSSPSWRGEQSVGSERAGDLLPHPAPPNAITPMMPPLLAQVRVERDAIARSLSATQIATLGGFQSDTPERRPLYRQRLLRSIARSAPDHIERVTLEPIYKASPRKIGEIVHRALRWWQFPTPQNDLGRLLRSYAWEEGIVDPGVLRDAVNEARALLTAFQRSQLFPLIDAAHRAGRHYTEIPFVYRTDKRTLHGKLDALIQTENGTWIVIDYKSSHVYGAYNAGVLEDHARRFYLQVGVYAAAVRQVINDDPEVYVHYIRHGRTIRVETAIWQSALAQLEAVIGDVLT